MKKLLLIAIAFCTFTACDDEDNSELWEKVNGQEEKIEMLESELEALKLKIEGLNQTFKAITEMLNGGLITGVEPVTDGDKSGYTFTVQTFDESAGTQINTYTVWNGESSVGPQIGMEKEEETGLYYWTLDGEPMLDDADQKIYTSKAPQLRINNSSKWEISYDDGATWKELGVFTGTISSSSISVKVEDNNVIISQQGKDDIVIPIVGANNIKIKFTNINAASGMRVVKNGVYLVEYELENASANATVKAEMLNGTNFEVENLPGQNQFKITGKGQNMNDVVLIHVYDGNVCMHTSFNLISDPAIKTIEIEKPEVLWGLEAGSDDVEYEGTLTLAEAASENLTFSVIPVGTYSSNVFVIEPEVTISAGSTTGTYKIVAKRSAMTAGTAYTIPSIIFSGENASYQVNGAVTVVAGVLVKVALTEANYDSPYTRAGSEGATNPEGYVPLYDDDKDTYWTSDYGTPPAGHMVYGVYIDVTLPANMKAMKFVYTPRNGNGKATELKIGIESGGSWELMEHITTGISQDNNVPYSTPLYSLTGYVSFNKVRFGIPKSNMGDLILNSAKSAAVAGLDVYGLY